MVKPNQLEPVVKPRIPRLKVGPCWAKGRVDSVCVDVRVELTRAKGQVGGQRPKVVLIRLGPNVKPSRLGPKVELNETFIVI